MLAAFTRRLRENPPAAVAGLTGVSAAGLSEWATDVAAYALATLPVSDDVVAPLLAAAQSGGAPAVASLVAGAGAGVLAQRFTIPTDWIDVEAVLDHAGERLDGEDAGPADETA